jgi:hypothetical protein
MGARRRYTVAVLEGVMAVNGRVCESVVDTGERTCAIADPHDPDTLAAWGVDAGRVIEQCERGEPPADAIEYVGRTAVVHDPGKSV